MTTECKWCGLPGTTQCQECWELETRIRQMPVVAKRMVREAMADTRTIRFVDAIGSIGSKGDTKLVATVMIFASLCIAFAAFSGFLQ
jgi:hypothetical protein